MLRLAAHAHVRLVSVIMCGERSSFFVVNTHVPASKLTQPLCHGAESDQRYAGAHASVRLVSSTMCREALRSMLTTHARIHRALHTCSLRHHVQRARRASAGATHTCLPRLSHHVRRVCGAYCGRHMHVSSSSPPQYAESAARFFGRHTQEFASSPPSRAESAARYASATHTCPPRLFHHLRRALRADLRAAHGCVRLVSAIICGKRYALLWATRTCVMMCASRFRHHVRRALRASDTQVSSSSPPSCALVYAPTAPFPLS